MRLLGLLFLGIGLCLGASVHKREIDKTTCGYKTCPKSEPKKINIHLVAHTHDDVGWLKTVDQYYYGSRMKIQVAGVQYIIDSVVDALEKDPARKFIYVETAFLWKWWLQQSEKRRDQMRRYINEGRLEIIGGGWSMNDEAVTHYHSMIDQYTWGFRRLNDTFGPCARPKIGWQIDPFGHSREQASMFAQFGFDGMFFGRLDYQDKNQRLTNKTGEFVWKGSASLGKSSELFTVMLYNNYGPPPGFCFDILCQDAEPMIDDVDSADYNIDQRLKQFLEFVDKQTKYYRTNNVILTMGGDFTYTYAEMYFKNLDKLISKFLKFVDVQASKYKTNNVILTMGEDFNYLNANMWYTNLDKLIRYINEKHGSAYNAFYSTPSCYLKSLNEQNLKWPTKSDDFFPYSSDPHTFWTGYFSSRPSLKFFERMGNNFLQIVKQLTVLTKGRDTKELQLFREAMGVMQHHDAVTGTEKQHVAEDYARILHHSFKNGEKIASRALNKWATKKQIKDFQLDFHSCLLMNVSSCEHSTNNRKFVVTVYNPTSQPMTTFVRLPVKGSAHGVRDYTGKHLVTQIVPISDQVKMIPGRFSEAENELVFEAKDIAPMGFQSFYVDESSPDIDVNNKQSDEPVNKSFSVRLNSDGKLAIRSTKTGRDIIQSFHYYEGATGNNEVFENRSSGAYIFRPKENFAKDFGQPGTFNVITGPLVEEGRYVINEWVSQIVKVYKNQPFVECDWLVGPIPVRDGIGKEIITRYTSDLKNAGEFFTDSNGREMLKRKLNYRPTWQIKLEEPISGNYYPITSKIFIEDNEARERLAVLTDRAQGGTGLKDGEIELMLHRRLLKDDAFGVGEALNETAFGGGLVVRGQHYLLSGSLDNIDEVIMTEKELALRLAMRPWIFVTPMLDSFKEYNEFFEMKGDGLMGKLPRNVQILTLEPWKDDEVLLRLEHMFEKNEARAYSAPVQVDLKNLFVGFNVHTIKETLLGANQWADDNKRLNWQAETDDVIDDNGTSDAATDSHVVTLKPMQIRTFVVKLAPKAKTTA